MPSDVEMTMSTVCFHVLRVVLSVGLIMGCTAPWSFSTWKYPTSVFLIMRARMDNSMNESSSSGRTHVSDGSTWSWHRLASSSSSRMAVTRISSDTMARILPTMSLLCRKSDMQAKFMLAWMVACVRGSRISHTTGRSSTALPLPVVPPGTSAVSPDVAAALRDWLGCLLSSGNSSFAAPSRVWMARISISVARHAESDCMMLVSEDWSERMSTDEYCFMGTRSRYL
mmetsp:Transcript_24600/g.46682  ORF Transcript_24600/g.46682 Transcript_24600/m.46682 type:complete len:227 (-) Transcript_24600:519-1199(-)